MQIPLKKNGKVNKLSENLMKVLNPQKKEDFELISKIRQTIINIRNKSVKVTISEEINKKI